MSYPYGSVEYMGYSLNYCARFVGTRTEITFGSFSRDGDHVHECDLDEDIAEELKQRAREQVARHGPPA